MLCYSCGQGFRLQCPGRTYPPSSHSFPLRRRLCYSRLIRAVKMCSHFRMFLTRQCRTDTRACDSGQQSHDHGLAAIGGACVTSTGVQKIYGAPVASPGHSHHSMGCSDVGDLVGA
eukprot:4816304-Amphidinium_carterae.1